MDEIHGANRDELAQLAASVQHFIRAGLPVALVFAGLPAAVSDLLDEGIATFLRRADRIDLHAAAIEEVEASYREVFTVLEHPIGQALLQDAAEATGGYPFLIQLVGYPPVAGSRVHKPAPGSRGCPCSRGSRPPAQHPHGSSRQPWPRPHPRTWSPTNTVGNYRARLIATGLIESAGHGLVDFAIPGLREHLRA